MKNKDSILIVGHNEALTTATKAALQMQFGNDTIIVAAAEAK